MASEGVTEELVPILGDESAISKAEKPLTPEEIWQMLDSESKIISCLLATYGISVTVPFLEAEVGPYLKKKFENDPNLSEEESSKIISKTVEADLAKLIGFGVVDWSTPRKTDQELVKKGLKNFKTTEDLGKRLSYNQEARSLEFQVAKKSLENRDPNEPGYNSQFVFINKQFKQLALQYSKLIQLS
jgi:hypothetical protein